MRLFAFILSLLLLAGAVDPTRGWLMALVVVTGIAAFRPRFWNLFDIRPAVDARLAAFVLAVLLLAGTVDPTRGWLIALSAVTGVAAFMPRAFALDVLGFGDRDARGRWDWDWDWGWGDRAARRWARWERRMERRRRRYDDRFGDGWS